MSCVHLYFLLPLLFQASSEPIALLGSCAELDHILAVLQPADVVRVRSAMAGGPQICYAVSAMVDGKSVDGYVLGEKLPAIADFERRRREATGDAPARPAGKPPLRVLPHKVPFEDFSAVDMKGKAVRLKDFKGKAVVICFWSPGSPASIRELLAVSRSFFELHKKGLDAIAVSLNANRGDIEDALEGSIAFPDIPDRYGLAARHGISNESAPFTFVLDQRLGVVAAGLHGAALDDAIRGTLKGE